MIRSIGSVSTRGVAAHAFEVQVHGRWAETFRAAACLLAAAGMIVASQLLAVRAVAAQAVNGSAILQTYTFDDPNAAGLESVQLLTLPFAVTVPITGGVAIQTSGAFAKGTATAESGQTVTLSGLTDTYIGVSARAGFDWLVVTARTSLPTGSSTHTPEESLVASVVAAELLPFAIKTWGSGGSVGGNVAAFRQVGGWGVGLTAGYNVASEYEPLAAQQLAYRPGDQMRLRLAVDHDLGASGTFSALIGFESYGNDQISGSDLFRSGNRIETIVSYAFAMGRRSSALVFGGVTHRSNGTLLVQSSQLGGASDSPSQQLFRLGANFWVPVGRRVRLRPTTETRVFRASDGASQGWIASAGSGLEWRVSGTATGRRFVLTPSGRVRLGRVIVSEGVQTGVMGWEAGITFGVIVGG